MNYDELKAAELKTLCEEKGIKPSRAKADMIADLKARAAADELSAFYSQDPAPLPDGVLAVSKEELAAADQDVAESASDEDVWVSDGRFYARFPRQGVYLGDDEHEENLRRVVEKVGETDLSHYGPSFRAAEECGVDYWVYAINVR